jgi:hypothetical protein
MECQCRHILPLSIALNWAAAQQGLSADAALRPKDRGDFEIRFRFERVPDLSVRRS